MDIVTIAVGGFMGVAIEMGIILYAEKGKWVLSKEASK